MQQVAIFIHSNVMFGLGMEKRGLDYQLYYFTHRAAAYSQGWVIFSRPADFLVVLVSNYIQFLGPKRENFQSIGGSHLGVPPGK